MVKVHQTTLAMKAKSSAGNSSAKHPRVRHLTREGGITSPTEVGVFPSIDTIHKPRNSAQIRKAERSIHYYVRRRLKNKTTKRCMQVAEMLSKLSHSEAITPHIQPHDPAPEPPMNPFQSADPLPPQGVEYNAYCEKVRQMNNARKGERRRRKVSTKQRIRLKSYLHDAHVRTSNWLTYRSEYLKQARESARTSCGRKSFDWNVHLPRIMERKTGHQLARCELVNLPPREVHVRSKLKKTRRELDQEDLEEHDRWAEAHSQFLSDTSNGLEGDTAGLGMEYDDGVGGTLFENEDGHFVSGVSNSSRVRTEAHVYDQAYWDRQWERNSQTARFYCERDYE
jgi:hypothetical protein